MKVTVMFYEDGTIRHIAGPGLSFLSELGTPLMFRASHVEPCNRILRWLFHAIRHVCDDDSRLADFTRRWPCHWQVDLALSGGGVLGPLRQRSDAIAAEVAWIEQHVLQGE